MIEKNVFLAPCSKERINERILPIGSRTPSKLLSIEGVILLDSIMDVLNPEEIDMLRRTYHDGKTRFWGTRFKNIWNSMKINDYVLFYQKERVISGGEVAYKTVNAALAAKVWGKHESGETWENIFFLKNVHELKIRRKALNHMAGYDETFVPQGFMRMRSEASQRFLKELRSRYG